MWDTTRSQVVSHMRADGFPHAPHLLTPVEVAALNAVAMKKHTADRHTKKSSGLRLSDAEIRLFDECSVAALEPSRNRWVLAVCKKAAVELLGKDRVLEILDNSKKKKG